MYFLHYSTTTATAPESVLMVINRSGGFWPGSRRRQRQDGSEMHSKEAPTRSGHKPKLFACAPVKSGKVSGFVQATRDFTVGSGRVSSSRPPFRALSGGPRGERGESGGVGCPYRRQQNRDGRRSRCLGKKIIPIRWVGNVRQLRVEPQCYCY
ncbi:hypothetical protein Trydic_g8787 [Trypoxylus dichotomus]